jgi:hypothetical protein
VSHSQDIRAWAATQGIELGKRGALPRAVIDEYEATHPNGADEPDVPDEEPMLIVPDAPLLEVVPPGEPVHPPAEERPPVPPKRQRWGRPAKPKDTKPATHKKLPRVSVANLVSSGWGLGAMALMRNGNAVPVARVLQMQAPVAGVVVDDLVKGTPIDRLLQPLARAGERGEKAVALLGPPILVAMITARPEMYPALRPMLKMALVSWVTVSGPAVKKAQADAARLEEEFGDVDLDSIIDQIFADLPAGVPSEQEEANIRKARGDQ